ncbi:GRINA [Symbiodinium natans]|uniref:GRINA protein n=1 Tax=Symbiodinium natans TaxID=878477 RepID=A0A812U6W6_9DINO|nr:GRINA [Symbiodinium natans]
MQKAEVRLREEFQAQLQAQATHADKERALLEAGFLQRLAGAERQRDSLQAQINYTVYDVSRDKDLLEARLRGELDDAKHHREVQEAKMFAVMQDAERQREIDQAKLSALLHDERRQHDVRQARLTETFRRHELKAQQLHEEQGDQLRQGRSEVAEERRRAGVLQSQLETAQAELVKAHACAFDLKAALENLKTLKELRDAEEKRRKETEESRQALLHHVKEVESQRARLQAQLDEIQAGYVSLKAEAEAERSKTRLAEQTLKERDVRVAQLLEEIQKYRSQQNLMKDEAIELAEHRAWLGEDQRWLLTLESRLKEEQKRAGELEDQLLEERKRCARRLEDMSQELLEEKAKCLELRKPSAADRPPRPAASADQAVAAVVAQPAKRAMLVAACVGHLASGDDLCKTEPYHALYRRASATALQKRAVCRGLSDHRHSSNPMQAPALFASLLISARRLCRRWHKGLRCKAGEVEVKPPRLEFLDDDPSCYTIGVLGDLHLDPGDLEDSMLGRQHMKQALEGQPNVFVVSLGDLGESTMCNDTKQLFSGTTACFQLGREYLDGLDASYDVVGGNHDLEGIDEFATDRENLAAFLDILGKETPQFCHEIAERTLLVGLGSTSFRSARFSSHEALQQIGQVSVDEEQLEWFEETIRAHPASEGWQVFVFSHAPIIGSALRVLQELHVLNGCCWLNHSDGASSKKFIQIVRENACIKGWFSGHFHLSHDYEDSITFPGGNRRGHCVFAQTGVMRSQSSRDGRRQSRLVKGNAQGFEIYTVDHKRGGELRLDATVLYSDSCDLPEELTISQEASECSTLTFAHKHEDYDHDLWFSAYVPQENDGCLIKDATGLLNPVGAEMEVCWWHMKDGAVLGVHSGMIIEYDASTLAPLGMVVSRDELQDRRVAVIDDEWGGSALVLYDDHTSDVTVVQPNEDGSYWRKVVRNKMHRMKEMRRMKAAERWAKKEKQLDKVRVLSSYGPYKTSSGKVLGLSTRAIDPKAVLDVKEMESMLKKERSHRQQFSDFVEDLEKRCWVLQKDLRLQSLPEVLAAERKQAVAITQRAVDFEDRCEKLQKNIDDMHIYMEKLSVESAQGAVAVQRANEMQEQYDQLRYTQTLRYLEL